MNGLLENTHLRPLRPSLPVLEGTFSKKTQLPNFFQRSIESGRERFTYPLTSPRVNGQLGQDRQGGSGDLFFVRKADHPRKRNPKADCRRKIGEEIGDLLFISARTVEHHRANIMKKLNVKMTADLVNYAIQKGYV